MNDDEKRVFILSFMGYDADPDTGLYRGTKIRFPVEEAPDPLNDLNAIREAEKVLTREQRMVYMDKLDEAVPMVTGGIDPVAVFAYQFAV